MTDDLIKRLRDWVPAEGPPEGRTAPDAVADMHEAAERIEALRLAVVHYDAALKSSWPYGATGDAWEHWNEARITLHEAGETFTRPSDT